MRFTRDWAGNRLPIHCCLLDAECWRDYREFHMPMRLHLHFLEHDDGFPVFFTLWGRRRSARFFEQIMAEGELANTAPNPSPILRVEGPDL